jgi:protein-tyrosine phosphatase
MPSAPFFKHILVVCVGNICRSPTAEQLLREAVADTGCIVESAGLGALAGKPINATALEILNEKGHTPGPHEARQITPAMLSAADLILVMEKRHLQDIGRTAPHARGKTFLLGKWLGDAEIPDPYRQDKAAFEHAYALIQDSVTAWAKRIRPPVSA